MRNRYVLAGIIAGLVVVLDQATKAAVGSGLRLWEVREVIPGFFNLVHVANRGAAFGFLNSPDIDWQTYFFGGVGLLAMAVVLYLIHKAGPGERLLVIALALILGGAAGNLIDRLRFGYVVDFLDVYVGRYHWPAFNVADSAITVGGIALACAMLFTGKEKHASGSD